MQGWTATTRHGVKCALRILDVYFKYTLEVYFQYIWSTLKVHFTLVKVLLQAFAFCVVDINSTVVSEHLEDLKNLIILNIFKEKLVIIFALWVLLPYLHILVTILLFVIEIQAYWMQRFFNLTNEVSTKKGYRARIIASNAKPFPNPFFKHFIQPSPPPTAKLQVLHGVSMGQLPP